MNYQIDFKPRAVKDLKKLPPQDNRRIVEKIEAMQSDLAGDVKRLTNFTPLRTWTIVTLLLGVSHWDASNGTARPVLSYFTSVSYIEYAIS